MPILADFSKAPRHSFRLLSEPGSATIQRYGIVNTTVPETNQQSYGIPFPGTFILNTQGVVTSRFFEQVLAALKDGCCRVVAVLSATTTSPARRLKACGRRNALAESADM